MTGVTVGEYVEEWLTDRDAKPRTRAHYRRLVDRFIIPAVGSVNLSCLTPATVRAWYAELNAGTPTIRAHAYGLLRTIMAGAVADEALTANPCRIRGASTAETIHRTRVASVAELDKIIGAMPERLRCMVLLAGWTGLRFGELTELRRRDVQGGRLSVTRGVVRADGAVIVGDPKSEAGRRTVAIPPHILPFVAEHLETHVAAPPDALLFPAGHGGHLAPSSLYGPFYKARALAGRSDLKFHDLRHTGATMAAATSGATLSELMNRLGHSTVSASMRYQHTVQDRDQAIADRMSKLHATA